VTGKDEPLDPEEKGSIVKSLFDMEQGIKGASPKFKIILRELLDQIIEKRLEYYIPLEDEDIEDTLREVS
jgi:hypothetical protein